MLNLISSFFHYALWCAVGLPVLILLWMFIDRHIQGPILKMFVLVLVGDAYYIYTREVGKGFLEAYRRISTKVREET